MNKQIKMVVFDMAGTTVNEDNVVYKTLRKAINEAGFNFSLDEVLIQGAGKEKKHAIRSVLSVYSGITNEVLTEQIYSSFIEQLTDAYVSAPIAPQPDANALLNALKERDILTVLNTGYDRKTAQLIIDKMGWTSGVNFDILVTASDVGKNRPDPDMILLAMEQLGITESAAVIKVGDSIIDIEEGKNAGCGLTVGITTGAHTAEQLASANPDLVIDNLLELLPLIAQHQA
ncbi:HAD-IA family hydrolase [Pedobacter duraquae]|uniref:Phosphonatase-like hydrolase n=1 Tax=Pedobacter duraquae TaxID=425511 RepID=A0A4R6IG16_9SPHI|nr:HAD-IA family hydrolase [Pedobacter duraquae]TDO20746.1 phosphonatase-like hydrolase [Pedobacter duraquae]